MGAGACSSSTCCPRFLLTAPPLALPLIRSSVLRCFARGGQRRLLFEATAAGAGGGWGGGGCCLLLAADCCLLLLLVCHGVGRKGKPQKLQLQEPFFGSKILPPTQRQTGMTSKSQVFFPFARLAQQKTHAQCSVSIDVCVCAHTRACADQRFEARQSVKQSRRNEGRKAETDVP